MAKAAQPHNPAETCQNIENAIADFMEARFTLNQDQLFAWVTANPTNSRKLLASMQHAAKVFSHITKNY